MSSNRDILSVRQVRPMASSSAKPETRLILCIDDDDVALRVRKACAVESLDTVC